MTRSGWDRLPVYLLLGSAFGLVLTKSEAVSWFRIQEMFRFQSFHMYGLMFSGVATAALLLRLLRGRPDSTNAPITLAPKILGTGRRYWMGGTVFGLGWGLAGSCPGPFFALVGAGLGVMVVALLSAVLGTWVYGRVRERLPH